MSIYHEYMVRYIQCVVLTPRSARTDNPREDGAWKQLNTLYAVARVAEARDMQRRPAQPADPRLL